MPKQPTLIMAVFLKIGATITRPIENICCYLHNRYKMRRSDVQNCRSGNILRFPRATLQLPRKKSTSWGMRGIGETPQCDEQNSHRVCFELRGALLHRDYL